MSELSAGRTSRWYQSLDWTQWKALIASNLGWTFDGFEVFALILTVGAALHELLDASEYGRIPVYAGAVIAITVFGWGAGGLLGGILADYIGRRRSMTLTILAYSALTGLSALSWNWWSFAVFRFLVGLAIGSEWATGASITAELWPDHARGKGGAFLQSGYPIGSILASAVWVAIGTLGPNAWRYMYLVGVLPALVAFWIRRNIPESPRWERSNQQRRAARDRKRQGAVMQGEDAAIVRFTLVDMFADPAVRSRLFLTFIMSLSVTIGYWGVSSFVPSYVGSVATAAGLAAQRWVGLAGLVQNIGALIGFVSFGFLADAFGRKPTTFLYYLISLALTPIVYLWVQDIHLLLLAFAVYGFFVQGVFSWTAIWLPELFPTRMRATAAGFIFNTPRLISAIAPLFAGTLIVGLGGYGKAATIIGLFYSVGLFAVPFLPETRGKPLPEADTVIASRTGPQTGLINAASNECGMYQDLREFITLVDKLGTLRRIEGADPKFEIGGITEVAAGSADCPALLFERMQGCAPGFRVFTNATTTPARAALALGIDPTLRPLDALKEWMKKRKSLTALAPVAVKTAPFLENSMRGSEVDLGKLPAPYWHRQDGGPFIGSGSLVVMRDPDEGWINASIYRVQVQNRTKVTIQFDHQGRHGAIIAKKYWDKGQSCPVAVVNGEDPSLFVAGFEYLPPGRSEYEFAGAIRGAPLAVIAGPHTHLPLPALAEIILEGELLPNSQEMLPEGPFGEFTGYYAADQRPCPVMEVKSISFRNDAILLGSPPMKPPRFHFGLPLRAATIWSNLDESGVTDVAGVWQHVSQLMTVVAIKQRYAGHAKRAGLIAAANSYMARLVLVVEDDVDPSDLAEVLWAVTTRCEPSEQIDIIRDAWSSALDPRIPAEKKTAGVTSHSKAIIDACRPFAWKDKFPPTSSLTQDEARKIEAKWGIALKGRRY